MKGYALGAFAALTLLLPGAAMAANITLTEFGARTSGMGTAGAALTDDTSAVFINPANVALLPGLQLQAGLSGLMPRWTYTAPGAQAEKTQLSLVTPPQLAATYSFGEIGIGTLAVGLGFSTPYGSAFAWDDDWTGREGLQSVDLRVYELSPVLALRPSKYFSLGVGLAYSPATVEMKRAVRFGDTAEGTVDLAGSGAAVSAVAGLSLFPMESLSLAISWRQGGTVEMEGDADFDFPAPFDTMAVDRAVTTELPLAQAFRFGAAWKATPELLVAADLEYQLWNAYEALTIREADGGILSSSPRNAEDAFVLHLGGEYRLNPKWTVRAGYIYDQAVIPDAFVNPAPPDSARHIATVGASYELTQMLALHAYYGHLFFVERETDTNELPGTWSGGHPGGSAAYMFGLTASAKLLQ